MQRIRKISFLFSQDDENPRTRHIVKISLSDSPDIKQEKLKIAQAIFQKLIQDEESISVTTHFRQQKQTRLQNRTFDSEVEAITNVNIEYLEKGDIDESKLKRLSPKQRKMIPLICDGTENKIIAGLLHEGYHNVRKMRRLIFKFFHVHNAAQLRKKLIL